MFVQQALHNINIAWVPNTETPKLEGAILKIPYKILSIFCIHMILTVSIKYRIMLYWFE